LLISSGERDAVLVSGPSSGRNVGLAAAFGGKFSEIESIAERRIRGLGGICVWV
jgi:hypothetical protein